LWLNVELPHHLLPSSIHRFPIFLRVTSASSFCGKLLQAQMMSWSMCPALHQPIRNLRVVGRFLRTSSRGKKALRLVTTMILTGLE
jgi:hypothetical protein